MFKAGSLAQYFRRTQQHRGRDGRHPAYSTNNQAIGLTSRKTKKHQSERRAECYGGNLGYLHRLVSKRQLKITICRGRRQPTLLAQDGLVHCGAKKQHLAQGRYSNKI